MIHDVQKFLFIGVKDDLDKFFETAQKRGFIEFIAPSGRKPLQTPHEVQELQAALKILRREGPARKADYIDEIDPDDLAKKIIKLKREEDEFVEKIRALKAEISQNTPLGDFSVEDIAQIEKETGKKVQFFAMKQGKRLESDEMIYLTTEHDHDYYMAMTEKGIGHKPGWVELNVNTSLSNLKGHLETADFAMHKRHEELLALTPYIEMLSDALRARLSDYHLAFAKEEVTDQLGDSLFSVEAWVPAPMVAKVQMLLRGLAVHAEEIAIEEGDRIPTVMENKGLNKSGEELVYIYDTPSNTDKDPSGWVLWFFAFFFGVIISDGGYGLLYLGLSLFLMYKFRKAAENIKKVIRLCTMLSVSCVVWGVVTASYFGLDLELNNPLQKVSVLHYLVLKKTEYHMQVKDDVYKEWVDKFPKLAVAKNPKEFLEGGVGMHNGAPAQLIRMEFSDNIMMEFALLFGVIHLMLSLLRYGPRNISSYGWVLFLIGGYMFFPKMLNATTMFNFLDIYTKAFAFQFGVFLLWGGLAFACIAALIQHKWYGLEEPTKVIQLFADVLSYLRLYALGLAGMVMASTFNQLGMDIGLLRGGVLIVIFGHAVNILLGIMGGVIHGLRLNFLEWYHYCFEGDGKRFNPLRIVK